MDIAFVNENLAPNTIIKILNTLQTKAYTQHARYAAIEYISSQ